MQTKEKKKKREEEESHKATYRDSRRRFAGEKRGPRTLLSRARKSERERERFEFDVINATSAPDLREVISCFVRERFTRRRLFHLSLSLALALALSTTCAASLKPGSSSPRVTDESIVLRRAVVDFLPVSFVRPLTLFSSSLLCLRQHQSPGE